jgi:Tfp pilus assembly protein PilO
VRRLTRREVVLVALAAAVAVVVPLYALVFGPEIHTLSAMSRRVGAQTVQLAAAEADAARVPDLERAQAAERARLASVEQQIPADITVSRLMGRLSTSIASSGVQLIEVTFPQGTQPSASPTDPIQELAFTVRLRGTFDRVVWFLRAMEAAPPVAVEQSLTLGGAAGAPAGVGSLDVTLAMKAIALR